MNTCESIYDKLTDQNEKKIFLSEGFHAEEDHAQGTEPRNRLLKI